MLNPEQIIERSAAILKVTEHIDMEEANAVQLHDAISRACMEAVTDTWIESENKRRNERQAFYLSAEYLMGRMIFNNLYCMRILDQVRDLLPFDHGPDTLFVVQIKMINKGYGSAGHVQCVERENRLRLLCADQRNA